MNTTAYYADHLLIGRYDVVCNCVFKSNFSIHMLPYRLNWPIIAFFLWVVKIVHSDKISNKCTQKRKEIPTHDILNYSKYLVKTKLYE